MHKRHSGHRGEIGEESTPLGRHFARCEYSEMSIQVIDCVRQGIIFLTCERRFLLPFGSLQVDIYVPSNIYWLVLSFYIFRNPGEGAFSEWFILDYKYSPTNDTLKSI